MNAALCGVPRYWPSWRAARSNPQTSNRSCATGTRAHRDCRQLAGAVGWQPAHRHLSEARRLRRLRDGENHARHQAGDGALHARWLGTNPKSRSGSPGQLTDTTTIKAALFVSGQKVGNTLVGTYRKRESTRTLPGLGTVETPTTVEQVLSRLPSADPKRGPGLFNAAGCVACHRAGNEGRAVGPDLRTIGDRDDADSLIRSILTRTRSSWKATDCSRCRPATEKGSRGFRIGERSHAQHGAVERRTGRHRQEHDRQPPQHPSVPDASV